MADWRSRILKHFTPQVSRLTLVADPDDLLVEEGILQGIRERGFELIPFEDPVAFRYAYESRFRSHWDNGEDTDLVVVLRSASGDLESLPYDLLQAGRRLSFSLGEIFPNLSYPVVASLDRSDLDALYQAQSQRSPGALGENATKDFVLRHVFEVAPELIRQPSDLLRVLLRRHYRGQRVPTMLDNRLIQLLRDNHVFDSWDLERIVPDRHAFLLFLQERWPMFVVKMTGGAPGGVAEGDESLGLEVRGPRDLPFDHDDVRVYIDNLFLEGLLTPVEDVSSGSLASEWVSVGVRRDLEADRQRRLEGLIGAVDAGIPGPEARHQEWLAFGYRWAELMVLLYEGGYDPGLAATKRALAVRERVDASFMAWVYRRYAGLHNQPALPPVMVHHIPRALAREVLQSDQSKVALLLLDGLALDQWIVLRKALLGQRPELRLIEGSVFAWVPTMTSVSRQAAFSGKAPIYFPASILTTGRDDAQWSQFWRDHGLAPHEASYTCGLDDTCLDCVAALLSDARVRALAVVLDKCDRIMHGMTLGTGGMHSQISQWASQGLLRDLVDLLHDHGFSVFLTSDHGNLEATGIGRPGEGVLAESRGQRVMIYNDAALRSAAAGRCAGAVEWPSIGLPDGFLALLAPGRQAFAIKGEVSVTHGGVSLEEVIVPFVRIERRGL